MKTKPANYKVNIITLGCSKNVVDSEVLLGQLPHLNPLQRRGLECITKFENHH